MLFVFENFPTLTSYIRDHLQVVLYVRNDADTHRSDCISDLLQIFKDCIDLDFTFLLSKGEQNFVEFLQLLDAFFVQSYLAKHKLEVVTIQASIFAQFYGFEDSDLAGRQAYERKKLNYQTMFSGLQAPSAELV